MSSAEKLKNEGNVAFKSGYFARAEDLYSTAERLDPTNPFYPSNLSAALYEQAKYLDTMKAIGRSRSKISDDVTKENLQSKLSTRLAKSLAFGVRNNVIPPSDLENEKDMIREYQEFSESVATKDDCRRAWSEWKRVERDLRRVKEGAKTARSRLASIPLRKKCAYPHTEYYAVGHDGPMSILHDWGPHDDDKQMLTLDINRMSQDQLSRLAIFFAGIGDARHALGSLIGINQTYHILNETQQQSFNVHLTLNDINPTTLARDLCLSSLLEELSSARGDEKTEAELKMTLLCTWFGFLMPSYCYNRLKSIITSLKVKLKTQPPNLPDWIFVIPSSIPDIIESLDHWLSDPNDRTARRLMQVYDRQMEHHPSRTMFGSNPDLPGPYQAMIAKVQREQEKAKKFVQTMSEEEIIKQTDRMMGFSKCPSPDKLQERREWFNMARNTLSELAIQVLRSSKNGPAKSSARASERHGFGHLPTFIPPRILRSQHSALDKYWDAALQTNSDSMQLKQEAYEEVRNTFRPNLTLYCSIKDDPNTSIDSVENVEMVDEFNQRMHLYDKDFVDDDCPCYSIMSVFFNAVVDSLTILRGHVKLEFYLGDYITALIKMQDGDDLERPAEFPRKYTRMWLSNVPDYVGGPLAVTLLTMPSLEASKEASVAGNCLLNTGLWQPGGDHYMFNYTHLSCRDYEHFLGGRIIQMKPDFGITEYAHGLEPFPLPLNKLPSHSEVDTWLSRVLIGILTPGTTVRAMSRVHNPHTLTIFIRLLIHMHTIGYPSHWLSDYLHLVLSDELVTDVVTYSAEPPTPLSFMGKRGTRRKVNLYPWRLEFETILVLSYETIPFPVPFPDDFAQHHADIAMFEAPSPTFGYATISLMYGYDPVFYLIFFRNGAQSRLGHSLSDILEGRRTGKGEVHILSIIDDFGIGKDKIRWRMSRKRVDLMQQEGWKFMAYRHDIKEYTLNSVSSTQWKEVQS
ncbi:hypothetical protein WG66_001557 [Moniliophthora roreri]|nr:hypothetical protein WG66_001557 [Moniliophthora roreri]